MKIKDFLKNLIGNLDEKSELKHSYGAELELTFETVEDDHMLANTIVPCLYIVDHDWPAEIKTIFDPK